MPNAGEKSLEEYDTQKQDCQESCCETGTAKLTLDTASGPEEHGQPLLTSEHTQVAVEGVGYRMIPATPQRRKRRLLVVGGSLLTGEPRFKKGMDTKWKKGEITK